MSEEERLKLEAAKIEAEKLKQLAELSKNGLKIGNFIMDNHGTMDIHAHMGESEGASEPKKFKLTKEILAKAIEEVQDYFWANSSFAVIFCVCRDRYDYVDNASKYENEARELPYKKEIKYPCTEGTLYNAFNRSPYLKYNIDKWEDNGAKDRVLVLRDKFIEVVERIKLEGIK